MDKEIRWILEQLAAKKISAVSADRMIQALKFLRTKEPPESTGQSDSIETIVPDQPKQMEGMDKSIEEPPPPDQSEPEMPETVAEDDGEIVEEQDTDSDEEDALEIASDEDQKDVEEDTDYEAGLLDLSDINGTKEAKFEESDQEEKTTDFIEFTLSPKLQSIRNNLQNILPTPLAERLSSAVNNIQGEYRFATAVFLEISSLPGTARSITPDQYIGIMGDCLKALVDIIYIKYEGCIGRIIDDRVIAFFGVPIIHEDDAERAVRAALEITESIGQLNMGASIGISTGSVYVGGIDEHLYPEFTPCSTDVDLAHILQNRAENGQVWVGESTHRLIGGIFDFDEPVEIAVGEKAELQKAYRVLGLSDQLDEIKEISDLDMEVLVEKTASEDAEDATRDEQETTTNILLVDDNVSNLNALERAFREDYKVFSATGGEEALSIIKRHEIALVIVNHSISGMPAVDLLERILQDHPNIIRILLTKQTDEELLKTAINRMRIHSFLPKPWEPEEIKITVKEAIRTYHSLRSPKRVSTEGKTSIGEVLLRNGLISREQLETAMKLQETGKQTGEVLISRGAISADEYGTALELQLAETLVGMGYVDERDIIFCHALQMGADHRLLTRISGDPELISLMPLKLAYKYSVIPVSTMGRSLVVASEKPLNNTEIGNLEDELGHPIIVRNLSDI